MQSRVWYHGNMSRKLPFRYLEPIFCAGLLDDPLLPVHLSKNHRGESRSLYEELEMPPGAALIKLPEHLTPRPLLASEMPILFGR